MAHSGNQLAPSEIITYAGLISINSLLERSTVCEATHMMQVMMEEHFLDRRTRFIMTCACSVGIGIAIAPGWATSTLGLLAVSCLLALQALLHRADLLLCADHLWIISDTASAGIRTVQYAPCPLARTEAALPCEPCLGDSSWL